MPTVPEQLRQAREGLGLDVHQVAEATKLKTDQIRALEQGDYAYFSAPIYLRGSIRTYAKLLKLDASQLLAQLEEELGSAAEHDSTGGGAERKRSGVDSITLLLSRMNWGIVAAIVVIAFVALIGNASYQGWQRHKNTDPLKRLGPGMYQPPEGTGDVLPLPTNFSGAR